jgi:phosphoribosylamine---glycine ligase
LMKILVIGGGGREHALVWRLRQSPRVAHIWCVRGNGGIAAEAECVSGDPGNVEQLVQIAEKLRPDLTIVGPELPLVNGVADAFRARDWAIVGPSKQAAQLEGSKIFAKEFLLRHGIPTARILGTFTSSADALSALQKSPFPLVLKADGLCAGKGVVLAQNRDEATEFIRRALERRELGRGGERLLVEETLAGDELSFIVMTDGRACAPLVPTRDHKRANDGNQGPNTGGMGAYSTDELLSPELRARIDREIVEPVTRGLAADGIVYQGFLYIGLMLTANGPRVLEFNCRLGDPEAQAICARMDFDLAEVLSDVANTRFSPQKLAWSRGASVCVVIASGGYPGQFATGKPISGLTGAGQIPCVKVLHAGTKLRDDALVTSGGRVLGVTATGPTLDLAAQTAYQAVAQIHFDGMHYRRDIGLHTIHSQAARS